MLLPVVWNKKWFTYYGLAPHDEYFIAYSYVRTFMNSTHERYTSSNYPNLICEKLDSRLRVQKENRSIFALEETAFAIVFIQAKHGGATVLHMQL